MTAALSPLRVDRVTASRLPAVLGLSPHTTRAQLLREMVREHFGDEPEFTGNIATEWGKQFEAQIIAEYELTQGVSLQGTGPRQETIVHGDYPMLAATPDGYTGDRVVEAKAPWKARWTSIAERPDYEVQLRLQMDVLCLAHGDLAVWRQGQPLQIETVEYDRDWLPSVLPAIETFLIEYRESIADPVLHMPHREPLKDQRTDAEWAWAAADWLELDYLIGQLTAQKDAAAARLKELAPDKSARGAGVDLLRFPRKGQVRYPQILKDMGVKVDVEQYRSAPTNVVSIRRVADKKEG